MRSPEQRILLDLGIYPHATAPVVGGGGGGGGESPWQHLKRLAQDPTLAYVLSSLTGTPFGALVRLTEQPR